MDLRAQARARDLSLLDSQARVSAEIEEAIRSKLGAGRKGMQAIAKEIGVRTGTSEWRWRVRGRRVRGVARKARSPERSSMRPHVRSNRNPNRGSLYALEDDRDDTPTPVQCRC
jgi:hypothetical protein